MAPVMGDTAAQIGPAVALIALIVAGIAALIVRGVRRFRANRTDPRRIASPQAPGSAAAPGCPDGPDTTRRDDHDQLASPDASRMRAMAAIACGFPGCAQTAATVELVPTGVAYADGQKDILHDIPGVSGQGTYRVSGFLPYANHSTGVADYEALADAVRGAGDEVAAALYGLDREYAPFFCATCGCSYCGTHWNLKPFFDQGFDYYSGDCPVGHGKFIDH